MGVPLRQGEPDVERFEEAVRRLVAARLELRACGAGPAELERNRACLVRAQLDLSQALIRRHLTDSTTN